MKTTRTIDQAIDQAITNMQGIANIVHCDDSSTSVEAIAVRTADILFAALCLLRDDASHKPPPLTVNEQLGVVERALRDLRLSNGNMRARTRAVEIEWAVNRAYHAATRGR